MTEIYANQAAIRGEVPSEEERRKRRQLHGRIRVVEHEALEALARAAEVGREPAQVDLSQWSQERGEPIDRWGGGRRAA